jgi:hypothetical protein
MPPPYLLGITLVTHENVDPELLKVELIGHLFDSKIKDPENKKDITHADLAQKCGIRIVDSAIEARTIADVTLLELKSLVRYTFVDHLSNSSMSVSS